MKYLVILICLSAISFRVNGQYYQKRNSKSEQNNYLPRQVTIELSPITVQNGKYYFDNRRVKFEEIVLPLISVNDKIVDHRLRVVRTMTDLRRPLRLLPLFYLTTISSRLPTTGSGYLSVIYTLWGIEAFFILYDISISITKRSAINRYNEVIIQPTVSLQPNSGANLGLSLKF